MRDLPPGLEVPEGLVEPLFPEPAEPGLWDLVCSSEVVDTVVTTVVTAAFVATLPIWLPGVLLSMWAFTQSDDGYG